MISDIINWIKNNVIKFTIIILSIIGGVVVWSITSKCQTNKLFSVAFEDEKCKTVVNNAVDLQNKFEYKDGEFIAKSKCSKFIAKFRVATNVEEAFNDVINKKTEAAIVNSLSSIPEDLSNKVNQLLLPKYNLSLFVAEVAIKNNNKIGIMNKHKFAEAIIKKIAGFENASFVYYDNKKSLLNAIDSAQIYAIVNLTNSASIQNVMKTTIYEPMIIYTSSNISNYLPIALNEYDKYNDKYTKTCKKCNLNICACNKTIIESEIIKTDDKSKKIDVKITTNAKNIKINTNSKDINVKRNYTNNQDKINDLKNRMNKLHKRKAS